MEEVGAPAVAALKAVEKEDPDYTLNGMRCLRGLLTPAARAALVPHMAAGKRMEDVRRAAAALEKDMWVDFHWRDDNYFLPKVIGMRAVRFPGSDFARLSGGLMHACQ